MPKWSHDGTFSSEFRRDVWEFSRFEGFLRVAFAVHAGAWLVGSWATRAGWLPVAATWLLKMENIAKIAKLSQNGKFSSDFRRDVWEFSRFEGFLKVACGVDASAWLVGSWATRAGKPVSKRF